MTSEHSHPEFLDNGEIRLSEKIRVNGMAPATVQEQIILHKRRILDAMRQYRAKVFLRPEAS